MTRYLCLDTETTGLNINCQVLTAYFIVLNSDFNEIDCLDLKIKYPRYIVELKAFEINKINLAKHDKIALDFIDAKNVLNTFLNKNKTGKYISLGHNVQFDLNKLIEFDIHSYISDTFYLDTMQISYFLKSIGKFPQTQSLSLTHLMDYYNIKPNGKLHTAECDIRATVDLFKKITTQLILPILIQPILIQPTQLEIDTANILLSFNKRVLRKRNNIKYY